MKQYWQRVVTRIDGLTLRERVIIFLMAVLALVTLMNILILEPLSLEQKKIAQRIQDEQGQIVRTRAEIQQKVAERTADPDAQNRIRITLLQRQLADLQQTVAGVQRGLISPDKMPPLLEDMLRKSTKLRLLSLKKLPVTSMVDMPGDAGAGEPVAPVAGLYRHGVELKVQGSYLDMVDYLSELERLSSQLFWGDVAFAVDRHPSAIMTLTLFTLSLDKQWLHI
jgi:MSHA biogenesis protein MshJ